MVGKRVREALYVHASAASELPEPQKARLDAALRHAGPATWNVARIEREVVALLLYADFEHDPFPALAASTRIDLISGRTSLRVFASTENPLILHRKELLVGPAHPQAAAWAVLTKALEDRGLFKDAHLIGRRKAWSERLAAAGVRVEAHVLCPT
jgi:DNA phosphorothioation-associated putative methyltransferase